MNAPRQRTVVESYLLPVDALTEGMYVTEIDRPWLDTPFLMAGFLVRNAREIEALRQHTRFAQVDLNRSKPELANSIRKAAIRRPGRRPDEPRGLRGWFRRMIGLGTDEAKTEATSGAQSAAQSADDARELGRLAASLQISGSQKLVRHASPKPIEHELPRARKRFERSADLLGTLMRDLNSDRRPALRDIEQVSDGLVESMIETPDAMLWVARMRAESQRTYMHCLRVALHLIALGRHIGFPREDLVRLGLVGMLADVGKIRVPRALLDKPGLLTPSEFEVVKLHVQLGIDALRKSMALDPRVEQGIAEHHERIDGSGYPKGLEGRHISIFGRMTAIADCFAALTTRRPYAPAQSAQDAMMNLYKWSGSSFHEPLVEQFVQAVGIFPVGGLIELSNGEIAIVVAHNQVRRLEPRVLVIAGPDRRPLNPPIERDLLMKPLDVDEAPIRIARGLPTGAFGLQPGDYYASRHAYADEPAGNPSNASRTR